MAKRKYPKMVKDLKKIQENLMSQMQSDIKNIEAEGTSAGDMVKLAIDGEYNVKSLKISPDLVDPEDIEFLEDSIIASFNDAVKKLNEQLNEKMSSVQSNLLGNLRI